MSCFLFPFFLTFLWLLPILHRHPHNLQSARTHTPDQVNPSSKRQTALNPKRHEESNPASSSHIRLAIPFPKRHSSPRTSFQPLILS
ncbi:hypothetical protein M747DRAFT_66786 [Aspergillus niger ATCC 13496]|uniref:Secreted protein n=1 Tax=Aspergillus niger ATCC 13496 TaxID=1353008 RepID=A0A370BUI5_ASPNG|nr:hypothetical protein M747DRAFT_66786 [Aspergillus niger ATCC 13496]